jgi:hypothetical protein
MDTAVRNSPRRWLGSRFCPLWIGKALQEVLLEIRLWNQHDLIIEAGGFRWQGAFSGLERMSARKPAVKGKRHRCAKRRKTKPE